MAPIFIPSLKVDASLLTRARPSFRSFFSFVSSAPPIEQRKFKAIEPRGLHFSSSLPLSLSLFFTSYLKTGALMSRYGCHQHARVCARTAILSTASDNKLRRGFRNIFSFFRLPTFHSPDRNWISISKRVTFVPRDDNKIDSARFKTSDKLAPRGGALWQQLFENDRVSRIPATYD